MATVASVSGALRSAHSEVCEWIDDPRRVVLSLVAVWLFVLLATIAHGKAFWHDEVYTVLTAQLPVVTFWRAALDGIDYAPPLNTLLTHAVQVISGPGLVWSRVPPM